MPEKAVCVVGGGHAGAEAALAAARLRLPVTLVTLSASTIGEMSCNPAVGGLAKGILVREIDALGGEMARATDRAGLSFRMLNGSKGPAVRSPRAQCDRAEYRSAVLSALTRTEGLNIVEDEAVAILCSGGEVTGVALASGGRVAASAVVLTTGTFLSGLIHVGDSRRPGGRWGERPSTELSKSLRELGFELGRLKTGTPPRIFRDSVDFSECQAVAGDEPPAPFSFATASVERLQEPCWQTRTTPRTHEIIRRNLHRAPLYTGQITAAGPRYCPSIEVKVVRWPDRDSHQVMLEPEGRGDALIYPGGLATSLPEEVQREMIASIPGLAGARVARWGYAIEYDYVPPRQLRSSLETKLIRGLYLAGQINGSSGYEEAAGQGLVAGVNAARRANGLPPWEPGRETSYIGVMIDDLVSHDITEPYRLFTSRSEYRLVLRQDNADRRLLDEAEMIGLLSPERLEAVREKSRRVEELKARLRSRRHGERTLEELLRRPEVSLAALAPLAPDLHLFSASPARRARGACGDLSPHLRPALPQPAGLALDGETPAVIAEAVEIETKYAGYVERMDRHRRSAADLARVRIPDRFDYGSLGGLKREAAEQLGRFQPSTLAAAARLAGVTHADVAVLEIALRRGASAPRKGASGGMTRALTALVLALAATAWSAAASDSSMVDNEISGAEPLSVRFRPVLGPWYRPGLAKGVVVEIRSPESLPPARVAVVAGGLRFQTAEPVRLSGAVRVGLSVILPGPGEPPAVEIVHEDGRPVFRGKVDRSLMKPLGESERLVVVAADSIEASGASAQAPSGPLAGGVTARVVQVSAGALPSTWIDYASADLLIIDELRPAALSERQREALRAHIRSGGAFMITSPVALMGLRDMLFARLPGAEGDPATWSSWKRVYGGADADVVLWRTDARRGREPAIVRVASGFGPGCFLGFSMGGAEKSDWVEAGSTEYLRLLASAGRSGAGGDPRICPALYDALPQRGPEGDALLAVRAGCVALLVALGIASALIWRGSGSRLKALAVLGGTAMAFAGLVVVFAPLPSASARSWTLTEVSSDGGTALRRHFAQVATFRAGKVSTPSLPREALPRALAYDDRELFSQAYTVAEGDGSALSDLRVERELPTILTAETAARSEPAPAVVCSLPGGRRFVCRSAMAGELSPACLVTGGAVRALTSLSTGAAFGEEESADAWIAREFPGDGASAPPALVGELLRRAQGRGGSFFFGWRPSVAHLVGLSPAGGVDWGEFVVVCIEEVRP